VAGALAGSPAVAAVLVPWRSSLPSTNVALLLVVVVVAVAANGRRGPGLLAAVGAALWFDFFWTLPYERFTITARADVETTALLLIVGAAVSELAARGRRSRQGVRTGAAYLASIHTAAGRAATGQTVHELIEQVRGELIEVLALRAARFEQGSYLGHPPRLDEHGELIWDSGRWDIAAHGLEIGRASCRERVLVTV
jgi:K+-sensing histidine kinase KdpD